METPMQNLEYATALGLDATFERRFVR